VLRVAFFTPLPPVPSGIAQYSAELLPLLGQALAVDVYVDGYRPTAELGPAIRTLLATRFEGEHRRRPYEAIIYQMGNSPAHAYMWPLIRRYPGLLVLHDVVLHHLWVWLAVNRRGAGDYLAEMERRYGADGLAEARRTLRGRMSDRVFDYPLCEALVEASPVVATHSAYAARLISERVVRTVPAIIPMGMPDYHLPDRDAARARLGLPLAAPVVASLGQLSPHKRMDVALRAFLRVRDRQPAALFVIAGAESPGLDLDRQVRMLGLGGAVRRLGRIAEASVPDLLAAADLVVNLRYPTAGETSASLLRILAAGKAAIATRAGSMAEIAPDACALVAPNAAEEEVLTELLARLLTDLPLRRALERNALAFMAAGHTLPGAAAAYLDLLGRWLGRDLPAPDWRQPVPDWRQPVPDWRQPVPDWRQPVIDARAGGPTLVPVPAPATPERVWPEADAVAAAIVELGLDRHAGLQRSVARALAELGRGPADEEPSVAGGTPPASP
jgi:glycosyltransferase involved in cell wall biosynthesis